MVYHIVQGFLLILFADNIRVRRSTAVEIVMENIRLREKLRRKALFVSIL